MEKVKEVLGEELFNQVQKKLGDKKLIFDPGEHMIPKSRLDEVSQQRDTFKTQLEEVNKELTGFKDKVKNVDDLQTQLKALAEKNESMQTEFAEKMKKQQLQSAIDTALLKNKAKNPAAVRALLDLNTVALDNGNVVGLEEQLKKIKESDGYLFGAEKIEGGEPETGGTPKATEFGGYASKTEWVKNDPAGFAKARESGFK